MNYQFELGRVLGQTQTAINYTIALIESRPNKIKKQESIIWSTMHERERNVIWTNMLIDLRLQLLKIFPSLKTSINELRTKIERLDEDNRYEVIVTYEGVSKTIILSW